MYLYAEGLENVLLSLATEGIQNQPAAARVRPINDELLLAQAYDYCQNLTAQHSRSFFLTSGLLPPAKRRAVRALYAFCRVTDDIVDRPASEEDVTAALNKWRQRALDTNPQPDDPVTIAWADARSHYQIPIRYAEQLVDGVARDTHQTRYQTFADLATYCYGAASTVGLMSMHIIGFDGPEALPYAIKLGLALQLTNILRDVGEDWRNGRLYLPQEELAAFGLAEADIARGEVDDRWRAFMRFQITRNRQLYVEAWPGIGLLEADGRFAIAAAAEIYGAILEDIETHDYDVFNRRAFVSTWGKIRRLPGLWWRSRNVTAPTHSTNQGQTSGYASLRPEA